MKRTSEQLIFDIAYDACLSPWRRWPAWLVTTYERAPPRLFLLAEDWWVWLVDGLPLAMARHLAMQWAGRAAIERARGAPPCEAEWSGWPGTLLFTVAWGALLAVVLAFVSFRPSPTGP